MCGRVILDGSLWKGIWLWQFMLLARGRADTRDTPGIPDHLLRRQKEGQRERLVLGCLTKWLRLCIGHQQTRDTKNRLKLVMEIIWHFKKNKEDFIIDNLRNFYTSLQSCFYLESYIDEGCVIVVFSVLYYALVRHSASRGGWQLRGSYELWWSSGSGSWTSIF